MYSAQQVHEATLKYFNQDELATSTFIKKYCLKDKENYLELTPSDMHRRLAREFARIESGYPNSLTEDEIFEQINNFSKIIPQGSPMYGIGNPKPVSLSNCVVVASPEDDMSSIMETGRDLANLFKRRCGVGVDLSLLRPETMPVNNAAGTTTGAWSYADYYSYICNHVGQKGRRGALMVSLDVRHPDVEKFALMKNDLTKVTGANISIRITNDFMEAVAKNKEFTLRWPVDSDSPLFTKTIKAKTLWDVIVKSATETAEPGILMWDNIVSTLPAEYYDLFKTLTTNPCGEIPLSAYDSCRLITLNLTGFLSYSDQDKIYLFDWESFVNSIGIATRMIDDLVDLEIEKLKQIIEKCDTEAEKALWTKLLHTCVAGRRVGLGTTGLADTLALLGYKYDSDEALLVVDGIYKTLRDTAYRTSIQLAKERGSFPSWVPEDSTVQYFNTFPNSILSEMKKYGRRNISILTNAPTGSCSILAQVSSGIEPVFRLQYTRKKKINYDEDLECTFVDANGERWLEYDVFHHNYHKWLSHKDPRICQDLVGPWITSDKIKWEQRVLIQSTIQQYIDHSISSTINLPEGTSPEIVSGIYKRAWQLGLKGVTVYVDGSRDGVLTTGTISSRNAPARPEELPCVVKRASIKGKQWLFIIGLLDGKPYEIFGGDMEDFAIPEDITKGTITKHPRKQKNTRYDFVYEDGSKNKTCRDLIKLVDNNEYTTLTRMTSMSLRHDVPIQYIVDQLKKNRQDTMLDFAPVLARMLKDFIPDGTKHDKECSECSANALIYQEGCLTCSNCGYAKCG